MFDSQFRGRRDFLRAAGFTAAGVGGGLLLPACAEPTEPSGDLGDYHLALADDDRPDGDALRPTEDNILGPYYRPGAPYRAKITPPLSAGTTLLVGGRVWGHDSKEPLRNAVLDVWQADHHGRYDNDDPKHPPVKGVFLNRARLLTDENGYYEYESVHPGRYKIGPDRWRPAHIHYLVRADGYRTLVTQLYFRGDPMNDKDDFIKPSLIIDVKRVRTAGGEYEQGAFDIVLAKA